MLSYFSPQVRFLGVTFLCEVVQYPAVLCRGHDVAGLSLAAKIKARLMKKEQEAAFNALPGVLCCACCAAPFYLQ